MLILVPAIVISGIGVYNTMFVVQYQEIRYEEPLYTLNGSYSNSAIVMMENPLWPVGTTLSDQKTYFYAASPVLTSTFRFEALARDVNLRISTVTKATLAMTAGGGSPFWKKDLIISEDTAQLNSDSFEKTISLNIKDLGDEISAISGVLNLRQGTPSAEIVTTVIYTGTLNGEEITGISTYSLPVELGSGYYSVAGDTVQSETVTTPRMRLVRKEPPVIEKYLLTAGFLILVAILIFVLITTISVRRQGGIDPEALKREDIRIEYKDWISSGRYTGLRNTDMIEFASLEDLVAAAVDMNQRVIYDENSGIYFFVVNELMYRYSEN
ncbi:hypothetical protein RJ53_07630 [Methanocalculus chunghsingensis]|uniref:DUF5305 domain-containing protein n=2 Tax=Methanocalculus chunghsingensis TaxID=156457 RepID=A0A8J8B546_9EURY|nr:hypothetical protein [Methanocalculus chunghsingensis]